jgi:hypothetical protein
MNISQGVEVGQMRLLTWCSIFMQRCGQDQTEFVAQLHGIHPRIYVQYQVHFEGFGFNIPAML